ncbi:MAG: phage tail sheath subtilisin-like domain-containing protein [Pyrinomonadaceae bacterium]
MPVESTYPEVYVQEAPARVQMISGVDTSITAFAGWAKKGRTDRAELVSSWNDFELKFGGLDKRSLLGYSVYQFFSNGGTRAYIVRLRASGGASAKAKVLQPNEPDFENALLPADGVGGLYLLDDIDLFNLLCVPGETASAIIKSLQKFCRDRCAFLIVDCDKSAKFNDLKIGLGSIVGDDSINAAFYFPWVLAGDPLQANAPREFPPCGFVAGVFARTDMHRGVWKAPAGSDASLTGVVGLAPDKNLSDGESGILNRQGVNCIRTFPLRGTVVWGGRTLRGSENLGSEWKYVSIRRIYLFIERSIDSGLSWVVFEPNGELLWTKIRQSVEDFLLALWRQGAFLGSKPEEAYFVKCNRDTMTQNEVTAGIVNVVIGFAAVKPAEFVIIRLQQMAQAEV